jgi:hypothetical protein
MGKTRKDRREHEQARIDREAKEKAKRADRRWERQSRWVDRNLEEE